MTANEPLVECIPNVSEGRRDEVVAALAEAVSRVRGVHLLDRSADPSHNRSVFTFAGTATAVEAAVYALAERAILEIDLRAHRGVHPRVGAVDVVPFVPLAGASTSLCVEIARATGAGLASRFGIPVFLYEDAATHPARRRLEEIRRGGIEGLAARMTRPGWAPDFGPARPHPTAGVTVVGARKPLVAFNVNLACDRLDVAQRIARDVRESSGGLPCVKALGLRLSHLNLVQVSMNLTDYTRTSLPRAFEAVAAGAAREGVTLAGSELIGLVPAAAFAGATPASIGLERFDSTRVLETRLAGAGLT